ncbi:unnamed protein product [Sphacelaria rigidula]
MRGEAFTFSAPSAWTTPAGSEGTFSLLSVSKHIRSAGSEVLSAKIGFRSKCKAKSEDGGSILGSSSVSGLIGLRAELGGVVPERVRQQQAVGSAVFPEQLKDDSHAALVIMISSLVHAVCLQSLGRRRK